MSNPYQPPSDQPSGQPYPQQGYPQQNYPQQNYPQQNYPQQGYAPQGPPPATSAPTPVTAAFFVYLATAALSLITIVLTLNSDIWDQAIAEGTRGADTGNIDPQQLVSIAKGIVIGVGVVFLAVYLLFAFKMRAGRNWARITLTVFSALGLLSTFNATGSVTVNNRTFTSTSSEVTGWIGTLLAIAAIVLMYLPASNAYFRDVKARRMQQKLQQYQR